VFACEMLLRSKSKAKKAMAAQAATLHSILLSTFCVLGQLYLRSFNARDVPFLPPRSIAHWDRSDASFRM
jgi:hypothetical protein